MEKENVAKKNAKILLFVIDGQTRNTASMVEIAELSITRNDRLVVVMSPYASHLQINGETVSKTYDFLFLTQFLK